MALIIHQSEGLLADRIHDCHEVKEATIIINSSLEKLSPEERVKTIVTEFNKGISNDDRIISNDSNRPDAVRVERGIFIIAHKNKVPEILAGDGKRAVIKVTAGYTETGFVPHGSLDGRHKQTEPLLGDYGKYIINVPQGQLARVWSGNTPRLLNEGSHVILDSLFRAETPMLVKRSDQVIDHGTLHIIRVPQGSLGKVLIESRPYLLPYRKDPYAFSTAFLKFDGFVLESEPYIAFGNLHLLRVPAGSVAKAWVGSKPHLLEYREEPYFFDTPQFHIDKIAGGRNEGLFDNAWKKQIQHGSINRLRPGVNGEVELAIVQHDGEITTIDRFTTIDNPDHAVLGFLDMGIQTFIFPSLETRQERLRENSKASLDQINFEPMTTCDSLKIGLKLLVAFQITDPLKLLKRLRMTEIVRHVESLAVSDMARAVQNSTSQNFLNASTKHQDELKENKMSVADRVRVELGKHLDGCGLNLVRFNVEEYKVLDEQLAREMSMQSMIAAKASAQQSVIEQTAAIARNKAEIEAMTRRLRQEQDNQILISSAKATLEAEKLRAQGTIFSGEASRKAAEKQSIVYEKYPEFLQLELIRAQAAALKSCRVSMCAESITTTPFFTMQSLLAQSAEATAMFPLPKEEPKPKQ